MIKNKNKGKSKGSFTLVELLAVIVVLAIILVIAVPKIMDVIKQSREGALVSSAKLIASQAETKYLSNTTLGITDTIKCEDVAKINNTDYESCSIKFDSSGKAKVTIVGKGKFDGMSVCNATRTSASVVDECVCLVEREEKIYSIKDYDSCVSYTKGVFVDSWGYSEEELQTVCEGDGIWEYTFNDYISELIVYEGFTEEELIENNVINTPTLNKVCITEETDASCFEFDSSTGTITDYDISCGSDVVIPEKIGGVSVTTIGEEAFYYSGIKSVIFPNTITTIGGVAFGDNLISGELDLHLTNLTTIGYDAFVGNNIESIILPEFVTEIGFAAFAWN